MSSSLEIEKEVFVSINQLEKVDFKIFPLYI